LERSDETSSIICAVTNWSWLEMIDIGLSCYLTRSIVVSTNGTNRPELGSLQGRRQTM
jgi:hypothetical protein